MNGDNFEYGYNGLGDRLQRTIDGEVQRYNLDLVVGMTQVLTSNDTHYLYGNNRLGQTDTNDLNYHLGDALNSVRQVATPGSAVRFTQSFEPFGITMLASNQDITAYGYAGEWRDPNGLIHLRARYYSPALGIFVQEDEWGGEINRPATLHQYSYVGNKPINLTDPSGMCYPPIEGLRNIPGEDRLCEYLDMAAFIWGAPMASDPEKVLAGTYIGGWALAHSLLIVGAGIFAAGSLIAGLELVGSIYGWAGTALSTSMSLGEATTLIGYGVATSELASYAAIGVEGYLTYEALVCNNQDAAAALWAGYSLTGESAIARGLGRAWTRLTSSLNSINRTTGQLQRAAARATAKVPSGSQPVYGTKVHTAFRDEVLALGRSDLFTEVSYLNGEIVPYGTSGSVRIDVVMGSSPNNPAALFDLKTGEALLTAARIQQLLSHMPSSVIKIPVILIKP
jgi:RHS repeat-associated protein